MTHELQKKILQLKKEKGFVIAAHSYQSPEVQEIADLVGDSFALSVDVGKMPQEKVILCGVRFMADTVKILSPEKQVILPAQNATCPMAEQITPEQVLAYKQAHPDHMVVAYVNTTTELKAACDVCVTSSVAQRVVERLDCSEILFVPDKNLGAYIQTLIPQKKVHLLDGCCPVHNALTGAEVLEAKAAYPGAEVLMHPECPPEALQHADYIGSTAGILQYAEQAAGDCIIGTEKSIAEILSYRFPERRFHVLSKKLICPDMRLTSLADVYRAMKGTGGQVIEIEESLRLRAKKPIDEMIRLGR